MNILICLILAVPTCMLVHEGGHFFMALHYRQRLTFHLQWGRLLGTIPIPRLIWDMPTFLPHEAQRNIALAGFATEIAASLPMAALSGKFGTICFLAALAHLVLYRWYADDDYNDFKWRK